MHIIMEHFGHTNLSAFIKAKSSRRVSENIGKKIFKQVVEAVKYCHDNSIAHRDIKMQNILLGANNQIKLIDFGFSTFMSSNQKVKFFCGTPSYMAPEIVRK